MQIPVTQLRTGMTITGSDGKGKTIVREITPCTQPGKVHVNKTMCYELIGYANVLVPLDVAKGE